MKRGGSEFPQLMETQSRKWKRSSVGHGKIVSGKNIAVDKSRKEMRLKSQVRLHDKRQCSGGKVVTGRH